MFGLPRFRGDLEKYLPTIRGMLKDEHLGIRTTAISLLQRLGEPIPREDLLQFLSVPNRETIAITMSQLRLESGDREGKYDLSNQKALLLLHNKEPLARMIGLTVLYQNGSPESVELSLPLLKDAESFVRKRAAATLRALSGQHFTEEQYADWEKWWSENKNSFVVQLHPEELRPPRRNLDNLRFPVNERPPTNLP